VPCKTCEKLRAAVAGIWQAQRRCLVRGCRANGPICRQHWNLLSLPLRQRWWRETNYGAERASAALVDAMNRDIAATTAERLVRSGTTLTQGTGATAQGGTA
jgi:hypothetical protein